MAREAARRCELERVLFIPAGRPPHKSAGPYAPYADRLRMVELATAGEPRFEASTLEEGDGASYTIDTIAKLRPALKPSDELFFLIGADAFAEIESWRQWLDVVRAVEFIVVSRPRHRYEIPPQARVHRLDGLELPTSSSDIRKKVANGNFDIDVPPAVLEYIKKYGLYARSG